MSEEKPFENFEDFWPFYLGEHRNPVSRKLHVAGTTAAVAMLGFGLATGRWKLALAAPLFGYGPAWVGHFIIEKNRPATFKHPLWSLRGDFKMASLMLTGQLRREMERLGITDIDTAADGEVIDLRDAAE